VGSKLVPLFLQPPMHAGVVTEFGGLPVRVLKALVTKKERCCSRDR